MDSIASISFLLIEYLHKKPSYLKRNCLQPDDPDNQILGPTSLRSSIFVGFFILAHRCCSYHGNIPTLWPQHFANCKVEKFSTFSYTRSTCAGQNPTQMLASHILTESHSSKAPKLAKNDVLTKTVLARGKGISLSH